KHLACDCKIQTEYLYYIQKVRYFTHKNIDFLGLMRVNLYPGGQVNELQSPQCIFLSKSIF
ncbi:MAG: hypothetical protein ACP5UA_10990, partial [Candidatus Hydrogenedens sp.]